MLQATPIPSLPPPSSSGFVQSPLNASTIDWEQAIKPPPRASSGTDKHPQRPRSTANLPPLVTTPPSSRPSRASLFLPIGHTNKTPSPPRSRATSPSKEPRSASSEAENETQDTIPSKSAKLASWFSGDSEPVSLSLVPSPKKEKSDPFSGSEGQEAAQVPDMDQTSAMSPIRPNVCGAIDSSPSTLHSKLQKRSSASPTRPQLPLTNPSSSTPSRFSFFKSKPPPSTSIAPHQDDPLLTLSIPQALFPHGPTSSFSPAAFKNLQQNAEGTLARYQKSYRETCEALRTLRSSHAVQADDLSASQTRASALKTQLAEMAARAQDQETALKRVTEELAFERQCRQEEEDLRRGTIRLIHHQPPPSLLSSSDASSEPAVGGGGGGKTYRGRRGRISDISATTSISSADLDASSEVDSVFSAPLEPHPRIASPVTTDGGGGMSPVTKPMVPSAAAQQPQPQPQMDCACCRGGAGAPGNGNRNSNSNNSNSNRNSNRNNNSNTAEAWDVVEVMREESRALKERIAELEGANEGALELLRGLGLQ